MASITGGAFGALVLACATRYGTTPDDAPAEAGPVEAAADPDAAAAEAAVPPDADAATDATCVSVDFRTIAAVTGLESPTATGEETGISLTDDERTAVFASSRGNRNQLYVAKRASRTAPFETPELAPIAVPAGAVSDEPYLSGDGLRLVYTAEISSGTDLALVARSSPSGPFTMTENLASVNSAAADRQPWVDAQNALWFASTRGTASAIYVAPRLASMYGAAKPVKLPAVGVSSPVLTRDGKTLFLAITEPGKSVIAVSRRVDQDSDFELPFVADTGSSMNPVERPTWISPDGCRLYFVSNRGTSGKRKLYVAGH